MSKPNEYTDFDAAEYLDSDEAAREYLSAALETNDPKFIAKAIGTVGRARNMSQIARDAGVSRESLYKALSGEGNPEFATIVKVINALGLHLTVGRLAGARCRG